MAYHNFKKKKGKFYFGSKYDRKELKEFTTAVGRVYKLVDMEEDEIGRIFMTGKHEDGEVLTCLFYDPADHGGMRTSIQED